MFVPFERTCTYLKAKNNTTNKQPRATDIARTIWIRLSNSPDLAMALTVIANYYRLTLRLEEGLTLTSVSATIDVASNMIHNRNHSGTCVNARAVMQTHKRK